MSSSVWGDKFVRRARPRSQMTGSQWADTYRYVAPGTSPEPGEWDTARVPYLREPMDCMTDRETEVTVMMCASQVAKSEMLLNIMGYYADQEPSPQLMLQPTVEAAESFSKERIDPTFKYSEGLKDKLEEGDTGRSHGSSRKSSNTIRMKHYPGGYLALVGANSPAGLSSRPIRVLLADEVDRYGITKEGDPLKLAIQRTTNFHNRKIGLVSTPTYHQQSKIEEWWDKSDQRRYHVPCPECGGMQYLKRGQLKWDKDRNGNHLPATARYQCEHCGHHILDSDKQDMLADGCWIADRPEVKGIAGFHINALYSPWVKFASLVEEWVEVNRTRDRKGLMEFINLKLGEPWVEDDEEDFDPDYLYYNRREHFNVEVPDGALLLTAGIDVQPDRLECEVVGWGLGRENWGIDYSVFMGSPAMPDVWNQLDQHLLRTFQRDDGTALPISGACIDSGDGNFMTEVYEFTKPREDRRIFSIKGRGGTGVPFIAKPTRNNRVGAALFTIGVDNGKANIMARLKIEEPGPGYCHFPADEDRGYDLDYFEGLLSETLRFKYVNGQTKMKWEKIRERNEPFDCRNYATAAMEILNPNFEWLAEQDDPAVLSNPPARRKRPKRRVISKGVR